MSTIIHDNTGNVKQAKQRKEATKNLLKLFKRVEKLELGLKTANERIRFLEEGE